MSVPSLVVFDLDFTLWDCGGTWCDCLSPPFRKVGQRVLDARDQHIRLYPDVMDILDQCDRSQIPIALASRTQEPTWAKELLSLLGIRSRFLFQEIYPSSKVRHFKALQSVTSFDYPSMLFFDDEQRNITECSAMGVQCVLVADGMTKQVFQSGLQKLTSNS